ncbi:MAG: 30S ribosomal protein S17 [Phycisphaerales bacterium]
MAENQTQKTSDQIKGAQIGVVESDTRNQTRTVVVGYFTKHPKYGKYLRQRTVLQVHDEANESRNGDRVEVAQCRPVSKTKNWKLVRIVERRADIAAALASAKAVAESAH